MKIGIIGYGHAGRLFRAALAELREEVVAVAEPARAEREELAARHPGIATTARFSEVAGDPSLDAVIVAAPVSQRFALVRQALDAGKHILVAAPHATTVAEAQILAELACRRERVLEVAIPGLHDPAFEGLQRAFRHPEAGSPRCLAIRRSRSARRSDPDYTWELAAQDLVLLARLRGEPPRWICAVVERPDRLDLAAGYGDGSIGSIEIGLGGRGLRSQLTASTRRWRAVLDDSNPVCSRLEIEARIGRNGIAHERRRETHPRDGLRSVCSAFLDAVATGRASQESASLVLDVIRTLDAVDRSRPAVA